jgi:hypothetical protein
VGFIGQGPYTRPLIFFSVIFNGASVYLTASLKEPARTAQSTLFILVSKTNPLCCMGAEVAVCSEINTKLINTVWAENTILEF